MTNLNHKASDVTHQLAVERGSFEGWDESKYSDPTEYADWFEQHTGQDPEDWEDGYPVRNHKKTTIAPTGTTSMLANTTGGCEPMYNVAYYKNVSPDVQGDEMLVEFDQYFLDVLEANDLDIEEVKEEANELMSTNQFTGVRDLESVPTEIGELFITTQELTPEQHAAVQCAAQEGVDSAISKTLNAPNESTVEDALEVMEYVYDNGGKGVTYYRDGSRSNQVLTTRKDNVEFAEDSEEELLNRLEERFSDEGFRQEVADLFLGFGEENSPEEMIEDLTAGVVGDVSAKEITPQERPKTLSGPSHRVNTGYGKLYVTINVDEYGRPMEVFVNIGESGSLIHSFTEALATLISMALRSGVSVDSVIDQLKGIRSPKIAWDEQEQIYSIPDGIATALERYMNGELEDEPSEKVQLESTIASMPDETSTETTTTPSEPTGNTAGTGIDEMTQEDKKCPLCGDYSVIKQEGCKKCSKDDCEFSLC
jgi:ribonucleoside-diphosphate reductase alpha chain